MGGNSSICSTDGIINSGTQNKHLLTTSFSKCSALDLNLDNCGEKTVYNHVSMALSLRSFLKVVLLEVEINVWNYNAVAVM
jgi:glutaminase